MDDRPAKTEVRLVVTLSTEHAASLLARLDSQDFKDDPRAVLADYGIVLGDDFEVKIIDLPDENALRVALETLEPDSDGDQMAIVPLSAVPIRWQLLGHAGRIT